MENRVESNEHELLSETSFSTIKNSVNTSEFIRLFGRIIIVFVIFIIFSIILIILKINIVEHIFILTFSVLSIFYFIFLGKFLEKYISNKNRKFEPSLKIVFSFMYILTSPLCLYIFFIKGLYGLYILFANFSFQNLSYIFFAIFLSFNLMKYIMKIERCAKFLLEIENEK